MQRKIEVLRKGGDESQDEAELLQLEMQDHDLAVLGALRETEALYAIYKSFPRRYTSEELNAAEEEYWHKRLTRQAAHELFSTGRLGVGNVDSLQQIGKPVTGALIREIEGQLCLQNHQEQPESWPISPSQ
jgi:hypothetical protein